MVEYPLESSNELKMTDEVVHQLRESLEDLRFDRFKHESIMD
ncbi:hypothetical protein [Atopobacter phocae]|nr:hypothetical protein [Atopobacter phocae]